MHMRYKPDELSDADADALHAHLMDWIIAVAPEEACRAGTAQIVQGVVAYARAAASSGVSSTLLKGWLGRGLWAAGRADLAERLLHGPDVHATTRATWRCLLGVSPASSALWHASTAGLIQSRSDWLAFEGQTVWMVDLTIMPRMMSELDLARWMAAQRFVSVLSPVWDASDGSGILGLRLPPRAPGKHRKAGHSHTWADLFNDVLCGEQRARGWSQRPCVVRVER